MSHVNRLEQNVVLKIAVVLAWALVVPPPSIVTVSVQVPYEAGMVPAPRAPAICAIQQARAVAVDSQEKER